MDDWIDWYWKNRNRNLTTRKEGVNETMIGEAFKKNCE
jgi:hypothetical protein